MLCGYITLVLSPQPTSTSSDKFSSLAHDKFLASHRKLVQGLLTVLKFELEQIVDAAALITANLDGTAPARLVEVAVLSHAASQLGPKPRVAVMGGILALEGSFSLFDAMREGIVTVVVAEDEATSWSLRTKVVVQPFTLVGGNSGCQTEESK